MGSKCLTLDDYAPLMLHKRTNKTYKIFISSLVEYMILLFLFKMAPVTLHNVITAKAKCNKIDATYNKIDAK